MKTKVGIAIYINQKLFPRPLIAHHKIFFLLKGHFIIYRKRSQHMRIQQYNIALPILHREGILLTGGGLLKGQGHEI